MNIDNVKSLRDFLAKIPETNFNHGNWLGYAKDTENNELIVKDVNVCGTTACIGGWAAVHAGLVPYTVDEENVVEVSWVDGDRIQIEAERWLGLNDFESSILFYPFDLDDGFDSLEFFTDDESEINITPEEYDKLPNKVFRSDTTVSQAVKFLDKMIETGEVKLQFWAEVKE